MQCMQLRWDSIAPYWFDVLVRGQWSLKLNFRYFPYIKVNNIIISLLSYRDQYYICLLQYENIVLYFDMK